MSVIHPISARCKRRDRKMARGVWPYALLLLVLSYPLVSFAENPPLFDLQGKQRTLSEFHGKWVLVNYWATWCPPCLEEMPELIRFHAKHKTHDAVVVGVNMEDFDAGTLKLFIKEQGINYPVWTSPATQQTSLGTVTGLPTSFLVSPKGVVVAKQVGGVTAQMIERFINK